jgi:hypothetical protein
MWSNHSVQFLRNQDEVLVFVPTSWYVERPGGTDPELIACEVPVMRFDGKKLSEPIVYKPQERLLFNSLTCRVMRFEDSFLIVAPGDFFSPGALYRLKGQGIEPLNSKESKRVQEQCRFKLMQGPNELFIRQVPRIDERTKRSGWEYLLNWPDLFHTERKKDNRGYFNLNHRNYEVTAANGEIRLIGTDYAMIPLLRLMVTKVNLSIPLLRHESFRKSEVEKKEKLKAINDNPLPIDENARFVLGRWFRFAQILANDDRAWIFLQIDSGPKVRRYFGSGPQFKADCTEQYVIEFDGRKVTKPLRLRSMIPNYHFHPNLSRIMRFERSFYCVQGGNESGKQGAIHRIEGREIIPLDAKESERVARLCGLDLKSDLGKLIHAMDASMEKTGWRHLWANDDIFRKDDGKSDDGDDWKEILYRFEFKGHKYQFDETSHRGNTYLFLSLMNLDDARPVQLFKFKHDLRMTLEQVVERKKQIQESQSQDKNAP